MSGGLVGNILLFSPNSENHTTTYVNASESHSKSEHHHSPRKAKHKSHHKSHHTSKHKHRCH